ncbi:phosphoribosylglycinamide formyltransferase [Caldalkalibacillus salinus]|uniref:phosphoribosylglycinamide formyltransferase n=1 Tax=Caldalkalibacillus salinus TaxID=2803787 RepID=UPI0019242AD0
MKRIAVFSSGSGSNFEAIAKYFEEKANIKVALLVCDQPQAYVIKRAERFGIPTHVVSPKDFSSKQAYEEDVLNQCASYKVDFIVLAGYMRLIGSTLLRPYSGKIMNIHPSLLPAFPGKDAIGQALADRVKVSGVTIHFVDEGMDTGPIIAQQAVNVEPEDNHESLGAKIQQVEHALYPKIVEQCVQQEVFLEGGQVQWQR